MSNLKLEIDKRLSIIEDLLDRKGFPPIGLVVGHLIAIALAQQYRITKLEERQDNDS